jgi:hypothetical protein
VKDIDKTIKTNKLYNINPSKKVIIKDRKMIKTVLFKIGETWTEYLSPLSAESPLLDFLQNKGERFHHITYQVDSIESVIDALPVGGQVSRRKSDVGDWLVADIHPKYSMGLRMQIIEECSGKV